MNLAAKQATQTVAEAFMLGRLALVPDLSGALYLPDERTLVVADLHLEKGSAYAARGVLLPPYDSAATLAALARADAATGLLDIRRLAHMLTRIGGHIVHQPLDHVSPLSVSVMLEIGREAVYGEAADEILAEAEAMLTEEAMA